MSLSAIARSASRSELFASSTCEAAAFPAIGSFRTLCTDARAVSSSGTVWGVLLQPNNAAAAAVAIAEFRISAFMIVAPKSLLLPARQSARSGRGISAAFTHGVHPFRRLGCIFLLHQRL